MGISKLENFLLCTREAAISIMLLAENAAARIVQRRLAHVERMQKLSTGALEEVQTSICHDEMI